MRSLRLVHLFPSVKKPVKLAYYADGGAFSRLIVIPSGNWNALSLAEFLQSELRKHVETANIEVTFDKSLLVFNFSQSLYIIGNDTTCSKELGLIPGKTGYVVKSEVPVNLIPTQTVVVDSNLSVHNQPPSGILNKIPLPTYLQYGQTFGYVNTSTDFSNLSSDFAIPSVRIRLLDDNGEPLIPLDTTQSEEYNKRVYPPWEIVLLVETVIHDSRGSLLNLL